jgi:hypothetical protein
MTYRYRYTGDLQTVFIHLQNPDRSTWAPHKGDEYESPVPIQHPLLQLISNAPAPIVPVATEPEEDEPDDVPETIESPVDDDAKEN